MPRRNIIKVPRQILDRIRTFGQDDVVVACAKHLSPTDVAAYAHLGLRLSPTGTLELPQPQTPDPGRGRYSKANVEGYEKVRKDLPKVSKEFGFWAPDWGDWSKGSHYVSNTREVYQRDFFPPKEVTLSVKLLEERSGGYLIKFEIDQVINQRTKNFEQELLYNLNLLQENVGTVDVFKSDATIEEFRKTVRIDWQILPPGSVDDIVAAVLKGKKALSKEQEDTVRARIEVIKRLNPEAYIAGTDGFSRYFGAKFGDDFIAFENARYGNAIYVMYEGWEKLSKRSRVDLLSGPRDEFDRIEHRDGWEDRFSALVRAYRNQKRRA